MTEIRYIASAKLEDPRLTSKRYIVMKNDKITTLCSMTGRNVEIVSVDETLWKIDKVEVPEALQRPPPSSATCATQLVKKVYMDMDDPMSNLSMESGEIESSMNISEGDIITESLFNENAGPSDAVSIQLKDNLPGNQSAAEEVPQTTKYTIPKVKEIQEETISQSIAEHTNPLEILMRNLKSKCEATAHTHEVEKGKPTKQNKETPKIVKDTSAIEGKLEENNSKDRIKLCISLSKLKCQPSQSAREIVAGDLELSDETCDDLEMQNNKTLKDKVQLDKLQKGVECGSHLSQDKSQNSQVNSNTEGNKCAPDVNTTEISPESSKKQKTKRRSQKGKSSKEISEPIATAKNHLYKKTRKKSKDSKPHTTQDRQAKFSELFGDSSSLITPEDLGLALVNVQHEKYVPIFEDTQDAVDVNVEEIGRGQNTSISVDTNGVQNEPLNNTEDKTISKPVDERKKKIKKLDEIKPDSTVEVPTSTEEIPLHIVMPEVTNDKTVISAEVATAPFQTEEMPKSVILEAPTLENLIPETVAKDLDVVKTIIISTGVQSQATNNMELPMTNNTVNLIEVNEEQDMPKIKDTPIHALATSTPYKEIPLVCSQIESDSGDNRLDKNEASIDDQSSVSNVDEQETDVPDIRIFVRRRKMKK